MFSYSIINICILILIFKVTQFFFSRFWHILPVSLSCLASFDVWSTYLPHNSIIVPLTGLEHILSVCFIKHMHEFYPIKCWFIACKTEFRSHTLKVSCYFHFYCQIFPIIYLKSCSWASKFPFRSSIPIFSLILPSIISISRIILIFYIVPIRINEFCFDILRVRFCNLQAVFSNFQWISC
jgi:hypothetical protein